ncbi:hypothetical protein ES703_121830 [subsurface metagenome]
MSELPFFPLPLKLGAEIQVENKKYQVVCVSRNETDKFKECEIKIESVERFLRKPAKHAIHKEPGGPVRMWPIR